MGRPRKLPGIFRRTLTPKFTPYRWISFKLRRIPRGRRLPEEERQSVLEMSGKIDHEKRELTFRGAALYDATVGDIHFAKNESIKSPFRTRLDMGDGEEEVRSLNHSSMMKLFEQGQEEEPDPENEPPNAREPQVIATVSPSWDHPIEDPPPVNGVRPPSTPQDVPAESRGSSSSSSTRYMLASPEERPPESSRSSCPGSGDRSPRSRSSSSSSTRYMLAPPRKRFSDSTSGSDGSSPRKFPKAGSPGLPISSTPVMKERSAQPLSEGRESTSIEHSPRNNTPPRRDLVLPGSEDHVRESQLVASSTEKREPGVGVDHPSRTRDHSSESSSGSVHVSAPQKTTPEKKSSTNGSRSPPVSQEVDTELRIEFEVSNSTAGSSSTEEGVSIISSQKSSPSFAPKLSPANSLEPALPCSDTLKTPESAEGGSSQLPTRRSSTSSQSPSPESREVDAPRSPADISSEGCQSPGLRASGIVRVSPSGSESPEIITHTRDLGPPSDRVSPQSSRGSPSGERCGSRHDVLETPRGSLVETLGSESEISETSNEQLNDRAEEPSLRDSENAPLGSPGSDSDSPEIIAHDRDDQDLVFSVKGSQVFSQDSYLEAGVSEFVSPEIITNSREEQRKDPSSEVSPGSSRDDASRSGEIEFLSPEIITRERDDRHEESSSHLHYRSSQDSCHSQALASEFVSPEITTSSRGDQCHEPLGRGSLSHTQKTSSGTPEPKSHLRRRNSIEPSEESGSGTDSSGSSDEVFPLIVGSQFSKASDGGNESPPGNDAVESERKHVPQNAGHERSKHSPAASSTSSSRDALFKLSNSHELPPEELENLVERVFGDVQPQTQSGDDGMSSSDSRKNTQTPEPSSTETKTPTLEDLHRLSRAPSTASSSSDALFKLSKSHELPPEELENLVERVFGDIENRTQSGGMSSSESSDSALTPDPRGTDEKSSALDALVSGDQTPVADDLSSFWLELARKETMDP